MHGTSNAIFGFGSGTTRLCRTLPLTSLYRQSCGRVSFAKWAVTFSFYACASFYNKNTQYLCTNCTSKFSRNRKIKIANFKKLTFSVNEIGLKWDFSVVQTILYPHPQKRPLEIKTCSALIVLNYLFFRRRAGALHLISHVVSLNAFYMLYLWPELLPFTHKKLSPRKQSFVRNENSFSSVYVIACEIISIYRGPLLLTVLLWLYTAY